MWKESNSSTKWGGVKGGGVGVSAERSHIGGSTDEPGNNAEIRARARLVDVHPQLGTLVSIVPRSPAGASGAAFGGGSVGRAT